MKKHLASIGSLVVFSICHTAYADKGLFFNVTGTSSGLNITTTIPNHVYPAAGIKLNTPGAKITGGCTPNGNGYCIFSVSIDTSAAMIGTTGASSTLSTTLCLNGKGPLSCQN